MSKQFTQQHIYNLCLNYKPTGLVKFRTLPKETKFYLPIPWIIGLTSYWLVNMSFQYNTDLPDINSVVKHLTENVVWPRDPMHATLQSIAGFLIENLHEFNFPFPLEEMCERIACHLLLHEFGTYAITL